MCDAHGTADFGAKETFQVTTNNTYFPSSKYNNYGI